jgi:hypothetical protein
MADTEEDVIVSIEGDAPVDAPEGDKPQTPDPVAELKSQFDEIKQTAEAEKTRREAAERREAEARRAAEAARKEAETFRTESVDSQFDAVTTGLAAAESEATSAEAEYASLMEKGDFVGAAKAQRRMSAAEAKILRFNEAKADLEARKTAPRTEDSRKRDPDTGRFVSDDPVEAFIASRTEPTANWLREHRDWLTDARKSRKLTAADADAQAEGHTPDTPAYFDYVERFLGLKKDDPKTESNGTANGGANGSAPQKRAAAPPVAPVNGGGGAHSSGDSRSGVTVTLTSGEAKAAQDGTLRWGKHDLAAGRIKDAKLVGEPIGVQEFARRKSQMQKAGAYDKSYSEN